MNYSEIQNTLIMVYNALNNIEVKGHSNVANLAGISQIVKELIEGLNEKEQTPDSGAAEQL